jgi:glycosyltransferase involved in cell wall biosynthesis
MYGGVEAMLLTHVRQRHLCPELETSFALCFAGRFSEELSAAGATVHSLGEVRVRQPLSVRRARLELRELLRSERADVVMTHSCWSHAIFAPAVRAASLPLVFYMHSPATGKHWLERWARRTPPDLVLCNSNFTAATSDQLFPQVKSETVYCPVAPPEPVDVAAVRKEVRAELQTPIDATVIIQVSRMETWKGHAQHLKALGSLKDLPGWVCWQVGGAQRPDEIGYVDELERLAATLGIADRVHFLGQRSDVQRLLAAADIFCQPNTAAEPFGIVFIEALAAQLPVVTSNIGGACEIVDDACGALVPPGDVGLLAETLRNLIRNCILRKKLGSAGLARARELCNPTTRINQFHGALSSIRGEAGLN